MKGIQTWLEFLRALFTGKRSSPAVPPSTGPPTPPAPPSRQEEQLYAPSNESNVARQYEQAARQAFRRGHYEEAIELAEHSLRLDPDNWMAYYYLGSAYLERGHFEEGIAAFERARERGDPLGLVAGWIQEAQQRISSTQGDGPGALEEASRMEADEEETDPRGT
jgi:tetratricopeptide (TPR) repeat protein